MDEAAFVRIKREIMRGFPPSGGDDLLGMEALQEVWLGRLRYTHREAHVITRGPEKIRLRAITQIAPDGFYVTAEVTVRLPD